MITLRPDQAALKAGIYRSWEHGARVVMGVLPTGGGKSVIVSDIVLDKYRAGCTQAVLAHRTELVGQMSLHVARRGIPHRIIAPKPVVAAVIADHRAEFGRSLINPDANTSVAAVDTLVARKEALKAWAEQVDDFTIDEGHHVLRVNKWGKAAAMFVNAKGLLVTASPCRADGQGLGAHADGIVDEMILGPTMRELINLGALSDYEIAVPQSDFEIDEDELAPSGDWSSKRMREASKRSHIVGDVVIEYIKRAWGKRFICFATDVETSGEIANNFLAHGIPVASVSADTPAELRSDYIRRFRAGQLWGLINVDLFGEGFDVPAVEVVIMARPTASLSVYLQQFGRALRVLPGKAFGLVIDHVSNWKRHGFPDKHHFWTMDRRDKRAKKERDPEEMDLTVCLACSRPYLRPLPACPHCGAIPIPPEGGRDIRKIDGDLILLDRAKLAEMRAAIELESPASVAQRVGHVAGAIAGQRALNDAIARHQAQQRLREAIAQWAGVQRFKGRSDQESYRRFFLASGVDVLSALAADRSRQDFEALAVKVEQWCGL